MGNHSSKHDLDVDHVATKKRKKEAAEEYKESGEGKIGRSLAKGLKSMKSLGKDKSVSAGDQEGPKTATTKRKSISRLDLSCDDSDLLEKLESLGLEGSKKERGSNKQRRASRRSHGNLELTERLALLDGSSRESAKGMMASRRKSDTFVLGKLDLSERLELLDGNSMGTIAKRRSDSIHKKERRRSEVFPRLNLSSAAVSSLELSEEFSVAEHDFNTMISTNQDSLLSTDFSAHSTNERVARKPKPARRISLRRLDPASVDISALEVPGKFQAVETKRKRKSKAKRRNTDGFRLDLSDVDFAALCKSFESEIRAENSSTRRRSSSSRRRSSGFRLNLNSINFADLDLSELGTLDDEELLAEDRQSTKPQLTRPEAQKDCSSPPDGKMPRSALLGSTTGSFNTNQCCNSKACSAA